MTDRTHGPFFPGDVCIGHGHIHWPEMNGMECVVLSPLVPNQSGIDPRTQFQNVADAHLVRWANGVEVWTAVLRLRLRPPKSDQSQWIREATTTWDQIQRETGWQPVRVET